MNGDDIVVDDATEICCCRCCCRNSACVSMMNDGVGRSLSRNKDFVSSDLFCGVVVVIIIDSHRHDKATIQTHLIKLLVDECRQGGRFI